MKYTFRRNSHIGAMDAESDNKYLKECFFETGDLQVLQDCSEPKRIVVGRVGAGKSALLGRLLETFPNAIEVKAEDLSLNWISNSDIIQFFENAGVKLDLFYQLLWKHVFVVELLKRRYRITDRDPKGFLTNFHELFRRDPAKQRAIQYLEQWGDKFWLDTEMRVKEFASKLEQKLSASIDTKYGPLTLNAAGAKNLSDEIRGEIVHKAQSIVNANQVRELGEIVNFLADDVFSDPLNRYYIVIDRLDDAWVDDRIRFKLIRALIETAKAFVRVRSVKIVVALREDLLRLVFDQTRDAGFQEEKYESLFLRLRWKPAQLRELLDLRIAMLVREQYTSRRVTFNDVFRGEVRGESAFDYVASRTLFRPRDVIAFVNCCIELCENKEYIPPSAVQDAEKKYSDGRLRSLADEWRNHYPDLVIYAELVRGRPASFKFTDITEEQFQSFMSDAFEALPDEDPFKQLVSEYLESKRSMNYCLQQILKILYTASVVGIKPQATDKTSWSFLEDRGVPDGQYKSSSSIQVHKMLWRALDTFLPPRLGSQRKG
ncbi:P-loop ATPase, Sll1717 family [Acidovorax sp. FJL06]|uniref:P-loop ATPase, Sll1717 family n=1 Tax=Acidovorax sp. FJL06 TaxID=2153365 RepID=UPI0018F69AA4|nr:ATPase [Acidovorax sp. FJL06]